MVLREKGVVLKKEPKNPAKSVRSKIFPIKKEEEAEPAVSIKKEDFTYNPSTLAQITTAMLSPGKQPCYYCGGGHDPSQCPSYFSLQRQTQSYIQSIVQYKQVVSGMCKQYNYLAQASFYCPITGHDIDPSVDSTLGWRGWIWDEVSETLLSPVIGTTWESAELRAEVYAPIKEIRSAAGIHAYRVPTDRKAKVCETILEIQEAQNSFGKLVRLSPPVNKKHIGFANEEFSQSVVKIPISPVFLHGIVERFGQYVLGEIGWRSEWAVIRELVAPTTALGLKLEQRFPEVKVHFPDSTSENRLKDMEF